MPLGRLFLKFHTKYGHGLGVAYYRDVVARRILQSPPVVSTLDPHTEVHVLMWKGDWIEGVWGLKSLYSSAAIQYSLCIHEDGSLTREQINEVRRQFPKARVIDRAHADAVVTPMLEGLPRCQAFRHTNPMALKVFDFHAFLQSDRMLLTDSDILFFARPEELLRRVEDRNYKLNTLNRDWNYGYSIQSRDVRPLLDFDFPDRINSGLGLIHRGSISFSAVERFLALPGIMSHSHRIEQTLIALSSARFGFEMLPPEYDVHTGRSRPADPCRHYTGPVRHMLYGEGIPRLIGLGLLKSRSQTELACRNR